MPVFNQQRTLPLPLFRSSSPLFDLLPYSNGNDDCKIKIQQLNGCHDIILHKICVITGTRVRQPLHISLAKKLIIGLDMMKRTFNYILNEKFLATGAWLITTDAQWLKNGNFMISVIREKLYEIWSRCDWGGELKGGWWHFKKNYNLLNKKLRRFGLLQLRNRTWDVLNQKLIRKKNGIIMNYQLSIYCSLRIRTFTIRKIYNWFIGWVFERNKVITGELRKSKIFFNC